MPKDKKYKMKPMPYIEGSMEEPRMKPMPYIEGSMEEPRMKPMPYYENDGLEDESLKPGKEYMMKKGGMTKSQKKIGTVMREFKKGKLKSSSGKKVTNPKQAIAIGLSEAGMSKMKKRGGGIAERGMGSALRGGGEAIAGMGAALKDGGKVFGGKESYDEELGEAKAVASKKISPKQFVKGEKSEGEKTGEKNTSNIAKKIASGKMSPKQYATMETSEKMQDGGMVRGSGAAIRGLKKVRIY